MEVSSLARGKDKQHITVVKPFYMTLKETTVHGNKLKAAISSSRSHLAQLHCQNYCLIKITCAASTTSRCQVTRYDL